MITNNKQVFGILDSGRSVFVWLSNTVKTHTRQKWKATSDNRPPARDLRLASANITSPTSETHAPSVSTAYSDELYRMGIIIIFWLLPERVSDGPKLEIEKGGWNEPKAKAAGDGTSHMKCRESDLY